MKLDLVKMRVRRAELGLSQTEAAEIAGISQTHYSFIEQGKRVPRLDDLSGIASALGMTAKDLLLESEENPTKPRPKKKERNAGRKPGWLTRLMAS